MTINTDVVFDNIDELPQEAYDELSGGRGEDEEEENEQ